MNNRTMASVGFTALVAGSSFIALPAQAAVDCGTPPSGFTINTIGDTCELSFTEGGANVNFTVPESATQLFALVVGGGGGSEYGYAGSAGQVRYRDLSSSIGTELAIVVGSGGTNEVLDELAGDDSSVSSASSGQSITASGATRTTDANGVCTIEGFPRWSYPYPGVGARSLKSSENNNNPCSTGFNRGVNPSTGDRDSNNIVGPAIFSSLTTTFGTGGRITHASQTLPNLNSGDGAGMAWDTDLSQYVNRQNAADGAVYLRWNYVSLANTGSTSFDNTIFATTLFGAGLALIAIASRRKKSRGVHRAQ